MGSEHNPRVWLASGSEVAGYRLEERIGAGGMAVVYRASDRRLGWQVAFKVLPPNLAMDDEFRARFVREWRAAAAVAHPHIVPVYEAGEADGVLCCPRHQAAAQPGPRRRPRLPLAARHQTRRCPPRPGRLKVQ